MAVHHLDCATLEPLGERLLRGAGSWFGAHRMVTHCLLVETTQGLVLVDTGFGLQDVAEPARRLGWSFTPVARPVLSAAQTARRQVEALGHDARDVRHIVLTHLDSDHAGGLADFPWATVHLTAAELGVAMHPRRLHDKLRYRSCQWSHGPQWRPHRAGGETFEGFGGVTAVVDPEVLLVPLAGHSTGHAAVAVRDGDRWQLHCGDAYLDRREVHADVPQCPPGLDWLQRSLAADRGMRLTNQRRLTELSRERSDQVILFCSHDAQELAAQQGS